MSRSSIKRGAARRSKDDKFEQPDTTLDELWEIIARGDFSLDVATFVDCWKQCERKGLGSDIAEVIPQAVASDGVEELPFLSLSQVTYLIFALIDGSEDRATLLQTVQSSTFEMMDYKDMIESRQEDKIRLRHFRALLPSLSQLLQIDECYIISWFVWHLKARFEMPDSLYEAFIAKVQAHRRKKGRQSLKSGDESGISITKDDFTKLFHSVHLSDYGLRWERAQSMFERTLKDMGSLLARRAETGGGLRHGRATVDFQALEEQMEKKDTGFVGRTQVTIFVEALYAALPSQAFLSPIDMVVAFIQCPDLVEEQRSEQRSSLVRSKTDPADRSSASPKRLSKKKRAATAPSLSAKQLNVGIGEFNDFVKELKDRFKVLDVNGDGFLDFDELSELLRETSHGDVDDDELRTIFRDLDGSGDGLIALEEFVNYISPDTPEASALKERFDSLDLNSDGNLDFKELCALLQRGNPGIKEHEVRILFDEADIDDDGVVGFDEFVAFIFNVDSRSKTSCQKTRHAAAAAKKARTEVEATLADVKPTFLQYGGRDHKINGNEFSKLCKNSGLFDHEFTAYDVDVIFAKAAKKGERTIGMKQFKAVLKLIAEKKDCPLSEVHEKVAAMAQ